MIRGKSEDFVQRMLENQQRLAEGLDPLPPGDSRKSAPRFLQEGGHMGDGRGLPGAGRQAAMPKYPRVKKAEAEIESDKPQKGQRVPFNKLVSRMTSIPAQNRQNRETLDGIPEGNRQTGYQDGADANARADAVEAGNSAKFAKKANKSSRYYGTEPNDPDKVNKANKVNPSSYMKSKPQPAPQDFPPQ